MWNRTMHIKGDWKLKFRIVGHAASIQDGCIHLLEIQLTHLADSLLAGNTTVSSNSGGDPQQRTRITQIQGFYLFEIQRIPGNCNPYVPPIQGLYSVGFFFIRGCRSTPQFPFEPSGGLIFDRGYLAEVGAALRSNGKFRESGSNESCRAEKPDGSKQWLSICWESSKIIKQWIVNN